MERTTNWRMINKADWLKNVRLTCTKCKRLWTIRTSTEKLYTPEIRAKWVCALCEKVMK